MRQALLSVDGVTEAEVTFDAAQAVVTYRPARVNVTALVQAVQESGFDAHVVEH